MLSGSYLILYKTLKTRISQDQMFDSDLHTLALGTDASFYRMKPKLVIKAVNEDEVSFILRECRKLNLPVTFRAAGTSVSGQSISDSVLLIAGKTWKKFEILDDGMKIRMQPGLTGTKVNNLLAPYHRKIGPDPASIHAAMMGGIIANNASGMCCGTSDNSYQTLDGMRIVFYDGTILDTGKEQSKNDLRKKHPEIIEGIIKLYNEIRSNQNVQDLIKKKFSIKNTCGYSVNAFLDFTDPIDIIEHLMVGSEGTLGFISEIKLRTQEILPVKACALIIFPDVENACKAARILTKQKVSTAELIDRYGLDIASKEYKVSLLKNISEYSAALLVETWAHTNDQLEEQIHDIQNSLKSIPVERPWKFTTKPEDQALYWKIRKGLFPTVCKNRKTGSSAIIEDLAFPISHLAEATRDLQSLFVKYNYHEAVIFGHALAGNLHFVFTPDFSIATEIDRYEKFMQEVSGLVVDKYNGSLKAEHGTGRNMAPFVEKEWGPEIYSIMVRIKKIFDPENILNPGVIINDDPNAHLKYLKILTPAHKLIDKCTECGFCEPSCISADLTLSARQRIAAYREISKLLQSGATPKLTTSLIKQFNYTGNQTCATDGLCALNCPVNIDTGKFIKEYRHLNHSKKQDVLAKWIARHYKAISNFLRFVLSMVSILHSIFGTKVFSFLTGIVRKISGNRIPQWHTSIPGGAKKIKLPKAQAKQQKQVVYFPSCLNRTMGTTKGYDGDVQLTEKMQVLIKKAGYEIVFPENMNDLCCGMAFSSKGFSEAGLEKSKQLEKALQNASSSGSIPILCDMSPCLFTMRENMEPGLKLYEPVEFILEYLIPNLKIIPVEETITIFPVCSMKKMGLEQKLLKLASLCAKEVIMPETNCCGFAGDRGFFYPELNAHGLKELREQIPQTVNQGFSTSRTCEIGLSKHTGISYRSIVYLVDKVSQKKDSPL